MGTPTGGPSQVASDGIVGRRRELDQLGGWLDAARQGSGRLVLCAGEPGIGKTRLAQELAGAALARGSAVAWGRCVETDGAPAFWPWRQVLRSLGVDPDSVLGGAAESPEDRFRLFEEITETVFAAAGSGALVIILDDMHWSDEPSVLVLRHLVDQLGSTSVLLLVTFRDVAATTLRSPALVDLLRSSSAERLDLRGFSATEVAEQLARLITLDASPDVDEILDITGGNPLFVREVARAVAAGTWRSDRPPRSVLDVVSARLDHVSVDCKRFVQAAAVVGREFTIAVPAAAIGEPLPNCLSLIDEAITHGLLDQMSDSSSCRFVHALIRDAVEASLSTADRAALHRAVAVATEAHFSANLSEHLADIARHWAELAPYGEAAVGRTWAIRAADDAVQRLAYEEGVRLYRNALEFDAAGLAGADRCRVLVALGRAAYFAGDLRTCADAATAAADVARTVRSAELIAEAALVLEATTDIGANTIAKQLCDEALSFLGDGEHEALEARLLAQRSHLAFYDGEQDRVESLSAAAVRLARSARDDSALVEALHARKEASPGPAGRRERERIATEMLEVARRTTNARTAMWGTVWRIDTLVEDGHIAEAADEVPALRVAVERVGGPFSAWALGRVEAFIAQAQGRYADASLAARQAFARMQPLERTPATGAHFALHCALAQHVRLPDDVTTFLLQPFEGPPRFRTMGRISRAFLQLRSGLPDDAAASYRELGPIHGWRLPVFFLHVGYVYATLVTIELGLTDDLAELVHRLEAMRGEHIVGESIAYLGPVELALGRGAFAARPGRRCH